MDAKKEVQAFSGSAQECWELIAKCYDNRDMEEVITELCYRISRLLEEAEVKASA